MRSLTLLFVGLIGIAALVSCHGGSRTIPAIQGSHQHLRSPLDVTQDDPTTCAEISTPSPSWATYTCYLQPNANVTLVDIQSPAGTASSPWTCSSGTWSIDVQQTGVPLPSPDVQVSPTVTGEGDTNCLRIDQVSVTIKTGATPLPGFDPVYIYAHEAVTQCDTINCAQNTNTGGKIKLAQGLHIQDKEIGKNIEGQTVTQPAGQLADLVQVAPEPKASGGCSWTMPTYYSKDALASYTTDDHPQSPAPIQSSPSPLATDEVTWYNDRGENPDELTLQCEVLPNGSSSPISLKAAANIGFETPTPNVHATYNPVFVSTNYLTAECQALSPPQIALTMGMQCPTASPGPGISWQYTITANDPNEQAGSIGLWQIIGTAYQKLVIGGSPDISSDSTCGDGNIPLKSGLPGMSGDIQSWNATWHDVDAPATASLNGASYAELGDSFDDYLMYRPAPAPYEQKPSIWISLGHFKWAFTANTSNSNGLWSLPTTTYATPGPSPMLDTATPAPAFPKLC